MFDPKDLQNLLGSVHEQLKEYEDRARDKVFTSKSGGGMVEVKFNGVGELIDVNIHDDLLQDKNTLQVLLISAINEAYKEVEDNKKGAAMDQLKGLNPFGKQFGGGF